MTTVQSIAASVVDLVGGAGSLGVAGLITTIVAAAGAMLSQAHRHIRLLRQEIIRLEQRVERQAEHIERQDRRMGQLERALARAGVALPGPT